MKAIASLIWTRSYLQTGNYASPRDLLTDSASCDHDSSSITVDLGRPAYHVSAVVMLPPQLDGQEGLFLHHKVFLSENNHNWGEPVAYGLWPREPKEKLSTFEPKPARYVRLVAESQAWVGISELNVYATPYAIPPDPTRGIWGPTIDFPIVPVAGATEASGMIILWSSWAPDLYFSSPGGQTATSQWHPFQHTVSQRTISDTHHDMFCPGISVDGTGMLLVTGGNDAEETSLYNITTGKWVTGPKMHFRRGYQSSVTLSDGRVFTIGGSWNGGSVTPKDGEIYDPIARTWTKLPGARVDPMLTDDMEGRWRSDNHGWLFGWKNLSIFQAGPSIAMHWYYVTDGGNVTDAGPRLHDQDSMSGNAVMFDAVAGKILTFGGAPDYEMSYATNHAHIITIGDPGTIPKVEVAGQNGGGMHSARAFGTSVILPDGTVFITGGQGYSLAFNEQNTMLTPELYFPHNNTFVQLQTNNIIRVYHSWSLLLPDATVLNGGGGLCGNCSANHYDAQVFTPPYLLTSSGQLRTRPEILTISRETATIGDEIFIRTRPKIGSASLVRLGGATHTVNTDQRRVPLLLKRVTRTEYSFTIPNDSGIVTPGYWMLFVMDAEGVPSVAKVIFISARVLGDPRPTVPRKQGYFFQKPAWESWESGCLQRVLGSLRWLWSWGV
ncbi:hypothetical protein ETB97_004612 [Aspergillus alliaceus]|uniref:Galactose oxidase n=1 Tax=Petromyces alliaceus TaxID=209559 RepID=A0A8H5ZWN7_PETAA|nr:hypothetical protein ETB97_004612 [Aspergillus burnettii]